MQLQVIWKVRTSFPSGGQSASLTLVIPGQQVKISQQAFERQIMHLINTVWNNTSKQQPIEYNMLHVWLRHQQGLKKIKSVPCLLN